MGLFSRISGLFGRGDEDILSVPPMDGVFKPNTLLDTAEHILSAPDIDNLAVANGRLHFSSGQHLHRLDGRVSTLMASFEAPVTMAAGAPDGRLVLATDDAGLWLLDGQGSLQTLAFASDGACSITAGLFEDDDTILLTIGSRRHAMGEWKRDLMSHGASGQLVRYRLSTKAVEVVEDRLAFPYGVIRRHDGGLVIAESWRHRLCVLPAGGSGSLTTVLGELPGYPARLAAASDGGAWLALFAPRRQLTELVLNENDYRLEMMTTIPPEHWIGPDFGESNDGEQPLQSGSVRQMGIMKPWAPSRSYGLLVRLDRDLRPLQSYHSRADGRMHGIVSMAEFDGHCYAAARGGGALLRLALPGRSQI